MDMKEPEDYYERKAQESLDTVPLLKGLVTLILGVILCGWLLGVASRMLGG
jgi:hypothetical protein